MGLIHLQAAACSRPTETTVAAQVAHLHREVEIGAYPAETEAGGVLERLHADLGALLGLDPAGVILTDSASTGLATLLATWPLPAVPVVAVAPSEWGPNLEALARRGAQLVPLAVDGDGVVDLEALDRLLGSEPVDVVHVVHAASHRGLIQPVVDVVARGRAHGVPVWVDAAQAVGHHDTSYAADAVYAPCRKWLRGPRGTGFLAVHPTYAAVAETARLRGPGDSSVAARVGLASAVHELVSAGPGETRRRLAEVGARLRAELAGLDGWAAADGPESGGAIVALAPSADQDVEEVQRRLLAEHDVLTTACLPWRAPGELTAPLLRLAPHVDVTDAELARAAAALASVSGPSAQET